MINTSTIANLLNENRLDDSTLEFLENIKFQRYHLENPERFEIINYVNSDPRIAYKIVTSKYQTGFGKKIKLKTSEQFNEEYQQLIRTNKDRKSTRHYSGNEMSKEELSNFLKLFYTITGSEKKELDDKHFIHHKRNIASGGGIYSTEIYLAITKIKGMEKGIYRYNVFDFQLEKIIGFETPEKEKEFFSILMADDIKEKRDIDYENTAVFLIFTSIINKHSFKYSDFGVLLSMVELGEFLHSAYLAGSALNLGCCAFGGVLNNEMNHYLDLRNPLHLPLMCMSLGKGIE